MYIYIYIERERFQPVESICREYLSIYIYIYIGIEREKIRRYRVCYTQELLSGWVTDAFFFPHLRQHVRDTLNDLPVEYSVEYPVEYLPPVLVPTIQQ